MWTFGHAERNMDQITNRTTQLAERPEDSGDRFSDRPARLR